MQELVTRFNEHLTSSNIGYKKGVEIVKQTIPNYIKMGSHKITFFLSLPPITCKPGYKCELVVNSQGQGNSPVILNEDKAPPERKAGISRTEGS